MASKLTKVSLIVLLLSCLVIPQVLLGPTHNQVLAQEPPPEPDPATDPVYPGRVTGTGTFFEITDSESANITLTSTEEVRVDLESIPRMISLIIEAAGGGANSTSLTLEGLEPNKTYYKFEDDSSVGSAFVSGENGGYTWTQDLIQPHVVWIQEEEATIRLPDDAAAYGTWDEATRTFTLEQDLADTVWITEGNITVDGNGYSVLGNGSGLGIVFGAITDVIVKNLSVQGFSYGFRPNNASNATLTNNKIVNNWKGIQFVYSSNITVNDSNVALNRFGIEISNNSSNITLNDNRVTNNMFGGVDVLGCDGNKLNSNNVSFNWWGINLENSNNNSLTGNGVSNHKGGIILNGSSHNTLLGNTISNNLYRAIDVLYSSDNNTFRNNVIVDTPDDAIMLYSSSNNTLEKNNISNNLEDGIIITRDSNDNILSNNIISNNGLGISIFDSNSNKVYHNDFIDNIEKPQIHMYYPTTGNVFDDGYPSGGNYWSDYAGADLYSGPGQDQPGSDSIGDTPYSIYNDEDRYPLIYPLFSWSFAIITDLHIGWGIPDYDGLYYNDDNTGQDYYLTTRLGRTVQWINENYGKPEYNIKFVVVTGDIADTAERSEFLRAREILNELEIPYIPLIGNHDIWPYIQKPTVDPDSRWPSIKYAAGENETLGDEYFETVFWGNDNQDNLNKIEGLFGENGLTRQEEQPGYAGPPYFQNYAFNYGGTHFVFLDFALREKRPLLLYPYSSILHQEAMDWFETELQTHQGEKVIIFAHYPFTGDGFFVSLGDIEDVINNSNCQVFNFAGHTHRNQVSRPDNEYDVVETEAILQAQLEFLGLPIYTPTGEFIRLVQVAGGEIKDINYDTLIDGFPLAINPYFTVNPEEVSVGQEITFDAYHRNREQSEIRKYYWNFGDGQTETIDYPQDNTFRKTYQTAGNYTVSLTVTDIHGVFETLSWTLEVKEDTWPTVNVYLPAPGLVPLLAGEENKDLTQPAYAQNTSGWAVITEITSPGKPVGALEIHFEQATQDIDLSSIHADTDLDMKKSVLYMSNWPVEVEESKMLYIPYSANGTVYVCSNATSLEEVTPQCLDKVPLSLGETVNGMTLTTTWYNDEQYYLVFGFTNGGGAVNLPPEADANGPYVGEEGSPITFNASNSTDPDSDPLQYRWDFNGDGTWDTGWLEVATANHTWGDDFVDSATLEVSDAEFTDSDTANVTVTNVSPTVGEITAPLDPVEVNAEITASATFSDPATDDTHVAIWDWSDNTTSEGYINETDGSVSGNHTYTAAGVYTITLTVTDDDGGSDESVFHYVVVYDPSAGFVTGGGWIDSPQGAYMDDPSLTGKANFGFVSKYQQGTQTPTGQTEFRFKAADLNFHSTIYEWLVVTGAKAKYKGEGTINGVGSYKFMLTAIDADINPNDSFDVDRFRIKIWDESSGTEVVIYDNALGDDSDAATTEIGGGSVVIHEG